MAAQRKHIYEFGPFRLIPSERQLLRANQPVSITPKTLDLLILLVENSGRLLGKEELLKCIWPDSFVKEANLSVNTSTLRHALGEGPEDHQYIETVPRHGYRFVADVKERWSENAQPPLYCRRCDALCFTGGRCFCCSCSRCLLPFWDSEANMPGITIGPRLKPS